MVFNLRTDSFGSSVEGDAAPPKSFSLKELQAATHNFSSDNISGEDWYGKVYRGRLADGSLVAIKRASSVNRSWEKKFKEQVQVGSTVSTHPNVLCLRGFCRTRKELLLVYPLMINNSLAYHLTERLDRFDQPLDWTTRKQIALGAARGLAHLHNQGNIRIMHRNICASNIQLNGHFEAVIGGSFLPMIMHEGDAGEGTIEWPTCIPRPATGVLFSSPVEENSANSGFAKDVCETIDGHSQSCPEYFYREKCTIKYDVFAYGRILLELISGQSIFKLRMLAYNECRILCTWISYLMNRNELGRVTDSNLRGDYAEEEVVQLVGLALLCSHEDPSIRPEMSEVVRRLESQLFQPDPSTRSSWSQSEYDSTPYHSFPPSPSPLSISSTSSPWPATLSNKVSASVFLFLKLYMFLSTLICMISLKYFIRIFYLFMTYSSSFME